MPKPLPHGPVRLACSAMALASAFAMTACELMPPAPVAPPPLAAPAPVAPVPPAPAPAPEPPPSSPLSLPPSAQDLADAATRELLVQHERLRGLSTAELGAEQARLEVALAGAPAGTQPATTLKLAQLLGRLARNGDSVRALALVEPLTRADAPAPWRGAARWLHSRLAEQRAQEEQIERLQQQVREQQRRLDQLQAQIEALRAIERSLGTRPAPP